MDKFGIFNLLNSFFPLTNTKTEQSPVGANSSNDILSSLLSSFAKNNQSNKNQETNAVKPINSTPHPLQEQMLLTVANHDAFVKRVKQNQKNF